MRSLSYDGMHNTYDADNSGAPPASPTRTPEAAATSPSRPPKSPRQIALGHRPVPIRSIPGYVGSPKQMCAVCQDNKHKTRTCCFLCSTASKVFAIHPPEVVYKHTVTYSCLAEHHADPDKKEHHQRCAIPTGKKRRGGKRRRIDDSDDD